MQTRDLCIQTFDCTRLFSVVFAQWVCNPPVCELKGNKLINCCVSNPKHKEHRARLPVSDYRCVRRCHHWSLISWTRSISNPSCCLWRSLSSVLQMDTACDDLVDLSVQVSRFSPVTQRLRSDLRLSWACEWFALSQQDVDD